MDDPRAGDLALAQSSMGGGSGGALVAVSSSAATRPAARAGHSLPVSSYVIQDAAYIVSLAVLAGLAAELGWPAAIGAPSCASDADIRER